MTYTLNTDALTALLLGRSGVNERFEAALFKRHTMMLNVVCYYELKRGLTLPRFVWRLAQFERFLTRYESLPMLGALDVAVDSCQTLRAEGTLLGDADIFTAAIAISNGAVLGTRNLKHFRRIDGLRLESWEQV